MTSLRRMARGTLLLTAVATAPCVVQAQRPLDRDAAAPAMRDTARWVQPNDWRRLGMFAVAAGVTLPLDRAIATAWQRPSVQSRRTLGDGLAVIADLGDPGALLISLGTYGVGRLSGRVGLADAGLHMSEAVVMSGVITNVLKGAIGRARPVTVHESQPFVFHPGGHEGYTAFPSGHTTVAFALAAAASAEFARSDLAQRMPRIGQIAGPALTTGAALVGVARMYHNAHWASDVIMAAGIGTVTAQVLVRGMHARPRSRVEQWLLPSGVAPTRNGFALTWHVPTA